MAKLRISKIEQPEAIRRHRPAYIRLIAAGCLVLAILFILSLLSSSPEPSPVPYSSLSYHPGGYRAFYNLLSGLGFPVTRLFSSYARLPSPETGVLLVLSPDLRAVLSSGESPGFMEQLSVHLHRWVERGGVLVFAGNTKRIYTLFGMEVNFSARVDVSNSEFSMEEVPRAEDFYFPLNCVLPETVDKGTLEGKVEGRGALDPHASFWKPPRGASGFERLDRYFTSRRHLPVFEEAPGDSIEIAKLNGRLIAVTCKYGAGRFVMVSTAYPFSNLALYKGNTGLFAAHLAQWATENGKRKVVFDEFTHGLLRRASKLSWLTGTALLYPFISLLILVLGLIWYFAVRLGPPAPGREVPRRAKEEYVVSLAEIYYLTGRFSAAARSILKGWFTYLGRCHGVNPKQAEEYFTSHNRALGAIAARVKRGEVNSQRRLLDVVDSLEREARNMADKKE